MLAPVDTVIPQKAETRSASRLVIGSHDSIQIRHYEFNRNIGVRLLYISDLHLTRWTMHIVEQLLATAADCMPDLVVLGGDLVDMKNGLPLLTHLIQALPSPVWAVEGNHDRMVGIDEVCECVKAAGGGWLDSAIDLQEGLTLKGQCRPTTGFSILCTHDPSIFPSAVSAGINVVLAGHLHGGQAILFSHHGRWFPGALVYRWNGPHFVDGQSIMLVSRGVHDSLPIRWNCPREVLLCSF